MLSAPESPGELAARIASNNTPPVVEIKNQQFTTDGVTALANALKTNTSIRALSVQCKLGDAAVEILIDGLRENRTIQKLTLASNMIHNSAVRFASSVLVGCAMPLEELNLCWNQIDDDGAKAIADGLIAHQHIRKVEVYFNNFTVQGMKHFLPALKKNGNLLTLSISAPGLTPKDIHSFEQYAIAEYGIANDRLKVLGQDAGANLFSPKREW